MTNKEHFKYEIFEIACGRGRVAVDKITNEPRTCEITSCSDCLFGEGDKLCRNELDKWLNSEYVEPCPFEKDELVEVSNNGTYWELRYFSHIDNGCSSSKFVTYMGGEKSGETAFKSRWEFCRKYGTLGGLLKGEQND